MNLDYVKIPFTNNPSMTRYDGPIYNKTPNKNTLEFGCGNGVHTEKILNFNPSKITAIDISEEAIQVAKDKGSNKINYIVENCEGTKLDSNSFDIIYGVGILHHLDLKKTVKEIKNDVSPID